MNNYNNNQKLSTMRLGTLAFLFGILICQTFTSFPDTHWIIWLFPLFILVLLILVPNLSNGWRIIIFFILGMVWTTWRADMILAQNLPAELEGREIKITGTVIGLPQYQNKPDGWRFDFAPYPLKEWENPGHLRLYWYQETPVSLRPGQQWQLTVRLKQKHGMLNPGGFDYEGWLFQHRLVATGSVRSNSLNEFISAMPPRWLAKLRYGWIDNFRFDLAEKLRQSLAHSPTAGIIIALALGERQWITEQQQQIFRQTGTAHLIAISGLHIGLVAMMTLLLAKILWGYIAGRLSLWVPVFYIAALMSLIATFSYALLAGFTLPTQRAFIMISVALISVVLLRRLAPFTILALALLIVLIYDPFSVLSMGFWLSFGAVAVIVYASSGRRQLTFSRFELKGREILKIQWAVTLGLSPFLLFYFNYLPLTSLLANLVAIPWMSFVIVPLTLLGNASDFLSPYLSVKLLQLAAYVVEALMVFLNHLSQLQWQLWQQPQPPLWSLLAAMIGIGILLSPLPITLFAKWLLGIIWLLPLFFSPSSLSYLQRGEVEITVLDVGQGLATLIRTENYVLLYDAGPKSRTGTGQAVIVPFLQAHGINHLDKLLISHEDNDHSGGLEAILQQIMVTEILTSAPATIREALPSNSNQLALDIPLRVCKTGQYWQWDGVEFKILHPSSQEVLGKTNNRSCVLKIKASGGSILLPGDIERKIEYQLMRHQQTELNADILLVPHHGSATSSSDSFIQVVNPKIALISSGYKNAFRHPKKQIVQRYQQRGIKILNTAQTGAIQLKITHQGISTPRLIREERRRYWHHDH
jgi:competence protein ComEC